MTTASVPTIVTEGRDVQRPAPRVWSRNAEVGQAASCSGVHPRQDVQAVARRARRDDEREMRKGMYMELSTPATWPTVPEALVNSARLTVLAALSTAPLERYYDVAGNYAGATFVGLKPNDPYDLTAADLHAVRMLSVSVEPAATRRLLNESSLRDHVLEALRSTPPDVSLATAGAAELECAWKLHLALKQALAEPFVKRVSNPWVTAAKLAARKRPALMPVRDRVVGAALEVLALNDGRIDLLLYRQLLADASVIDAIETAVKGARARADEAGSHCVFDDEPLRLLDAALWWVGTRGRDAQSRER